MFLYLDSSAIVKLAVQEAETSGVEGAVATCRAAFSSKLAVVECSRAAARVSDKRLLATLSEIFEALVLHEVNDEVVARAASLTPSFVRSLDAIHLATALLLDQPDLAFVTYDDTLARTADTHGLKVLQPKAAV